MPFINLAASSRAFGSRNYSIQAVAIGTGGTISYNGGYTIHTFTTTGNTTFTLTQPVNVEYLVVAGGGGGGGSASGAGSGGSGGGAGGALFGSTIAPSGSFTVTVGTGGNGGAVGSNGVAGVNSSVIGLGLIAVGGGYGGGSYPNAGGVGGSGGGGAYTTGGAGTTGQGMKGGDATGSWGSGGGGQSKVGSNTASTQTGTGGDGLYSAVSGTGTWYAGGGGGGNESGATVTNGGQGGGGAGGIGSAAGTVGTANTGGGGGGGGYSNRAGGNGGSGIVIIRYLTQLAAVPNIDQYRANVAAHISFDGSNGGTVVTDSSPAPKAVTLSNVTTVTTPAGYFGTACGAFNGTTSYAAIQSSPDLDFGTGDFTIEFRVYLNSTVVSQGMFGNSDTVGFVRIYTDSGGYLHCYNGTDNPCTASPISIVGTWTHIACVRVGTTFKIFVNGISQSLTGGTGSSSYSAATTPYIGAVKGSYFGNCCIDELRVTTGIARYTNNFTVPTVVHPTLGTTIPYDLHYDNTVLSLHMQGTNTGTNIVDSSSYSKVPATNSNVTTSTVVTHSGFGTSTALLASSYLQYNSSTDFTFGTGDFTMEAWVYQTDAATGSGQPLFYVGQSSAYMNLMIRLNPDWMLSMADGAAYQISETQFATRQQNTWAHIAVTRASGTVRVFYNGTISGTWPSITYNMAQTGGMWIGGNYAGEYLNGNIQDVRVTKGIARYVANFTPPTSLYPDTGGFATINAADKDNYFTLSNGNLTTSTNVSGTGIARATIGRTYGKWYWEAQPTAVPVEMGIATGTKAINAHGAQDYLGGSAGGTLGYGYYSTSGNLYSAGGSAAFGASYTTTDLIGFALDQDNATLSIYKNNVLQGIKTGLGTTTQYFPAIGEQSDGTGKGATYNFGQNPLKYTPPNGTFWNPKDAAGSFTGTNNNLIGTITTSTHNVRALTSKTTGKWYFEIKIISGAAGLHEGLMTAAGSLTAYMDTQATDCKSCLNGALYGTGKGSNGSAHADGDVIGWAFDGDAHTVQIFKNGVANSGGFTGLPSVAYFPAFGSNGGTVSAQLNTGATPWAYPGSVPSGYTAWDTSTYQLLSIPSSDTATSLTGGVNYPASKTTLTYTGADQSYVVPAGVQRIRVKMWGAGGQDVGSGAGVGGPGGYVSGEIAVTAGESLTVIVGQGGTGTPGAMYGGGSAGGTTGGGGNPGNGGGRSAIRRGASELITAGGGGGTSSNGMNNGGYGGGLTGGAGQTDGGTGSTTGGSGGSQVAGGNAGASGNGGGAATAGTQYTGGTGGTAVETGGGGGGGYYGGGGGGAWGSGSADGSGGGGGSSYYGGCISGSTTAGSTGTVTAPNNGDADYAAGVAVGGNTTSGGNGRVVIY